MKLKEKVIFKRESIKEEEVKKLAKSFVKQGVIEYDRVYWAMENSFKLFGKNLVFEDDKVLSDYVDMIMKEIEVITAK